MIPDAIAYQDRPGRRVLDLRKDGLACIPVLGLSDFHMIHPGTDFHVHPEGVEINLCVRGNLAFETAERTYPFLPGSIFVSTPAQPHRMRHNPKGLLLYRILFRPPKAPERFVQLARRMAEHPGEDYRLPALADELGLSLSSFSETFKRTTGLPPHAYLVSCRIRRAQELLARGTSSLKAISDSLGFSSTQHFATTFRSLTGLPPSRVAKRPAHRTPKHGRH